MRMVIIIVVVLYGTLSLIHISESRDKLLTAIESIRDECIVPVDTSSVFDGYYEAIDTTDYYGGE